MLVLNEIHADESGVEAVLRPPPGFIARRLLYWAAPIQPVPLHRPRVTSQAGKVHTHLPRADYAYRLELRQEWLRSGLIRHPLTELDLMVAMRFVGCDTTTDVLGRRRHVRRPDLSNLVKAVEDAGNGILWADDAQIVTMAGFIAAWGPPPITPQVQLLAWELVPA